MCVPPSFPLSSLLTSLAGDVLTECSDFRVLHSMVGDTRGPLDARLQTIEEEMNIKGVQDTMDEHHRHQTDWEERVRAEPNPDESEEETEESEEEEVGEEEGSEHLLEIHELGAVLIAML